MRRASAVTDRKREILTYLVAGRTYSEIARTLALSEKTVSVHVSNMLHKTGTANRAELAHRVDAPAGNGHQHANRVLRPIDLWNSGTRPERGPLGRVPADQ